MNKLSDKILDKIKQENVCPKPRWHFIALHSLLIAATIFSIIAGSIAVAIIIRHFSWADWELVNHFYQHKLQSLLVLLPYLWIGFVLLAIFLADQLFKHTKTGHRRRPLVIILTSVLLSLNFGYILYLAKLDRPVEKVILTNIPAYQRWEAEKDRIFVAPELGVIAGRIDRIHSEKEWLLVDFSNRKWSIDVTQAKLKNNFIPAEKMHVGIIGRPLDDQHFKAKVISVWKKQIVIPLPPIEIFEQQMPGRAPAPTPDGSPDL